MTGRFWLITLLALIATILIASRFIQFFPQPASQPEPGIITSVTIDNKQVNVEIADDPQEIQQGLSNRPSMPQDQGMLFVFPQKTTPSFWMKDMQFPLDFIWIDQNTIVSIMRNIPPSTPGQQLQLYTPSVPVTHVLEVNAGWTNQNQIRVGDQVIFN